MKPRRVILTLEVETNAPLRELRRVAGYELTVGSRDEYWEVDVIQAQANVIKEGER